MMLLKSTTMIAVCMAYLIILVQFQLSNASISSSFQSTSHSGTGSSYVFNSGFVFSASASSNLQPTAFPDPIVEVFAHSLVQLLRNSKLFESVTPFTLDDDPYEIFLKDGIKLLQADGEFDPTVAERVADAAKSVSSLTSDLYFSAISHMLGKVLLYDDVLTQDTALSYPKTVLSYVEDYARSNGISDGYSVIRSVSNGVNNFLDSLGLATSGTAVLSFKIFIEELKALASGAKI